MKSSSLLLVLLCSVVQFTSVLVPGFLQSQSPEICDNLIDDDGDGTVDCDDTDCIDRSTKKKSFYTTAIRKYLVYDVDNDGDLDVIGVRYVSPGDSPGNYLFLNDGQGELYEDILF